MTPIHLPELESEFLAEGFEQGRAPVQTVKNGYKALKIKRDDPDQTLTATEERLLFESALHCSRGDYSGLGPEATMVMAMLISEKGITHFRAEDVAAAEADTSTVEEIVEGPEVTIGE